MVLVATQCRLDEGMRDFVLKVLALFIYMMNELYSIKYIMIFRIKNRTTEVLYEKFK